MLTTIPSAYIHYKLAHTGADQISSFSDFVYTPVSNPRTKTSRRPGPQLASTARLWDLPSNGSQEGLSGSHCCPSQHLCQKVDARPRTTMSRRPCPHEIAAGEPRISPPSESQAVWEGPQALPSHHLWYTPPSRKRATMSRRPGPHDATAGSLPSWPPSGFQSVLEGCHSRNSVTPINQ